MIMQSWALSNLCIIAELKYSFRNLTFNYIYFMYCIMCIVSYGAPKGPRVLLLKHMFTRQGYQLLSQGLFVYHSKTINPSLSRWTVVCDTFSIFKKGLFLYLLLLFPSLYKQVFQRVEHRELESSIPWSFIASFSTLFNSPVTLLFCFPLAAIIALFSVVTAGRTKPMGPILYFSNHC